MKEFHLDLLTNKLNIRWFQILNEFERLEDLSLSELSQATQSTTRTIRTDIVTLTEYFGDSILITSTTSRYTFQINDLTSYHQLKAKIMNEEPLFIMVTGIFAGQLISISDWAERLHLSEPTLVRYIQKLKDVLDTYDLKLYFRPINIIGSEENIRRFFFSFFYESSSVPHTLFPSPEIQQINQAFSEYCQENTRLTIQFTMFCFMLMIVIERVKNGNELVLTSDLKRKLASDPDFKLMTKLNHMIKEIYHFELSADECCYLLFMLIIHRNRGKNIDNIAYEKDFIKRYSTSKIAAFVEDYCTKAELLDLPFTRNTVYNILLTTLVTNHYLKYELSPVYVKNIVDLTDYIDKSYTVEFNYNVSILTDNAFFDDLYKEVPIKEIAVKLTMFNIIVGKVYPERPKNIAVLLEGDHNLCAMIQAMAMEHLGMHNLFFIDMVTHNENYVVANKIDMIVTNSPDYLRHPLTDVRYSLLKKFPTVDDFNQLLYRLSSLETKNYGRKMPGY